MALANRLILARSRAKHHAEGRFSFSAVRKCRFNDGSESKSSSLLKLV